MKPGQAIVLAALLIGSFVSVVMFYALKYPLFNSFIGGLIAFAVCCLVGAILT